MATRTFLSLIAFFTGFFATAQNGQLIHLKILPESGWRHNIAFQDSSQTAYAWFVNDADGPFNASIWDDQDPQVITPSIGDMFVIYNEDLEFVDHFETDFSSNVEPMHAGSNRFIFNFFTGDYGPNAIFDSEPQVISPHDEPVTIQGLTHVLTYNSETGTLEMPFHCLTDQGENSDYQPYPWFHISMHMPAPIWHLAAWTEDQKVITVVNKFGYFTELNWEEEFLMDDDDTWGCIWVKTDPFTGETEAVPMYSNKGANITNGIFPTTDQTSVYRTGTLRGDSAQVSPDGTLWQTNGNDSLFYSYLLKETIDGDNEWTLPLFTYNNSRSDTGVNNHIQATIQNIDLVELEGDAYLSQLVRLGVYHLDDSLYYNDFIEGENLIGIPEDYESELPGFYSKTFNKIYRVGENGSLKSTFTFPEGGPSPGDDSFRSGYHMPRLIKIDDKLGWTQSYSASEDTTISCIETNASTGFVDTVSLDLPAGRGVFVLWLDAEFNILDFTNFPFYAASSTYYPLGISNVVKYNSDTLMIFGSIHLGTTTSLDPEGQAEEITYSDPQTFLAFYSMPEILTNISETESGHLKSSISVYPNPASESVNLKTNLPSDANYQILDLSGRVISKGNIPANKVSTLLKVGDLTPGLYFIRVTSAGFDDVERIVVER